MKRMRGQRKSIWPARLLWLALLLVWVAAPALTALAQMPPIQDQPPLPPPPEQAPPAPLPTPSPAPAAPPRAKAKPSAADGLVEMNFKNVDIINFLAIMSENIGVPFVWDESQIKGKITLVSPRRFSQKDAYKLFETVLEMHGYTTVRRQDSPVVQVIPIKDAARLPSRIDAGTGEAPKGSGFVTRIITLKYADPNQVKVALTPLVTSSAILAVYQPANVLLLSDVERNVARLMEIVDKLDVEPGDISYQVIPLQYASARKMAEVLNQVTNAISRSRMVPGQPPGQSGMTVVADERINALVVVADPSSISQVTKLVEALDIAGKTEAGGFKVYPLKHANAETMEKVLTMVKTGTEKLGQQVRAGQPPIPPSPGGQGPEGLTITSDKATNSIILIGSPDMISTMDQVITKLDVRRPQVYVEALIMEVTLEKSLQLGIRWQTNTQTANGVVGGGFPSAAPATLDQALANGNSAVVGVVGNQITFEGQSFVSFSAFIEATQQDQDLNILANPQLLTMDNEEAEINVSQVIPVSSRSVRDNNLITTTEFEFKDVGIILKITPQITGNDKVRLKINQESSSVAAKQVTNSSNNQQAITTLKRTINSTVLVDNNATMAIGGLIQDKTVSTDTKVPCLGDIPALGWFFKSRGENLQKTNLIVFIRPIIINSREDLEKLTRQVKRNYDMNRAPSADTEKNLRGVFSIPPEKKAE